MLARCFRDQFDRSARMDRQQHLIVGLGRVKSIDGRDRSAVDAIAQRCQICIRLFFMEDLETVDVEGISGRRWILFAG